MSARFSSLPLAGVGAMVMAPRKPRRNRRLWPGSPPIDRLLASPLGLSIASGATLVGALLCLEGQGRLGPLLLALGGAIAQILLFQQLSFRRTQTALKEAEAKFATIFRTSPDPVAIVTLAEGRLHKTEQWLEQYSQLSPGKIYTLVREPNGHLWFEYISSAVETINEVTAQAVLEDRQVIFNMFYPEDVAGYEAATLESMQTLKPLSHQWQIITPSGRVKWVQDYAQPSRSETGATIWHGVVIDISERARLEAERKHNEAKRQQVEVALQESETRFRQLAEAVKEGFFVYDVEAAHYAYVNPAYWEIRGMAPDYGPHSEAQWLARIHPDDRDRIVAALARERQGENFDQEYRYITPSGELRWLRSKAFPLLDDAGNVARVVGTVENITDRKRTEAALRQSETRFRSAFDDAPYGISLVDVTGQFVQANAYYCALLGYSEAELLHLTFQAITHPDDRADDWAAFQRMVAGETRASQIKKRYLTKQGEVIPVVISAAPIHDEAGQPRYSVGHVQDLRDRQAIDRMKDEFISVVSHELRTPITAIQGALALLGAGVYEGRPAKARHMLEIAINNSDRLVRLVDDILSFERLESGKVQLEKELCQVAHLLYQAIDAVQPLADQSGITIALTPLATTLWAAPDGVIQVLTNLLSNAIKFSASGGTVWVKASTERLDAEASNLSVLFTVRDHGRGIPPEKLEVIFDQFQQVDASDSRQRGGTGLGLAICKRIVQQHRGRIWVESVVGEGSTFSVALPLRQEQSHD